MQKANYISTATTSGGSGKYPLSTQTLDFIQQQILLLQQFGYIGGSKYILKSPDGASTGLAFIDGEMLTLAAKPAMSATMKYVVVTESTEDVQADGETYVEARTYRTAALSAFLATSTDGSVTSYKISDFSTLTTNQTLAERITQMPQVVLNYLTDILAAKLPLLFKTGVTNAQIDALLDPCVISCESSVAINGQTSYGIVVLPCGADGSRLQIAYTLDGSKYTRIYVGGTGWQDSGTWHREQQNMNIEVKIALGTVYIRHGELPAGAKIVLLRKKRRSSWRRTGGSKSYSQNVGKRIKRQPKRAWCNYKGIYMTKGNANEWYVPRCAGVANTTADKDALNKELGGICRPLITQRADDADGNAVYRVSGLRKYVTTGDRNTTRQNSGFVEIGLQVVVTDADGTRMVGGNIAKLKYHIRRLKVRTGVVNGKTVYSYTFYRSFSMN